MKWLRYQRIVLTAGLYSILSGCAVYKAAPLTVTPPFQSSLQALNHQRPGGGTIPAGTPVSAQNMAALAVLNDPNLIAARAQHGVAAADLLSAGLLPDPSITGGFGAFVSGPGNVPSISASLTEDLSALITYRVNREAAKDSLAQVDAGILWQEWQVASQVEQLCITIDGDQRIIITLQTDHAALAAVDTRTQAQMAAANLTIAAASASMAALAATDTALNAAIQAEAQDRNQLDALLGLQPGIEIPVTVPAPPPLDAGVTAQAIATLADRRPDLIALRDGYGQQDAKLRVAILTQFLPISIGAAGGRDTTNVVSIGPQATLTLPLFNHNRGGIASATATRAQLAAEFQSSLASAAGGAQALQARIILLQTQSMSADQQAQSAAGMAAQAQTAFANGSLDALSAVNLQTASSDRAREAIALRVQLLTARLSLTALLGIGLPTLAEPGLETVK